MNHVARITGWSDHRFISETALARQYGEPPTRYGERTRERLSARTEGQQNFWPTARIYDMMWMAALALRRDGTSTPPE